MNKCIFIILFLIPYNLFAQDKILNFVMPVTYLVNRDKLLTTIATNLAKYNSISVVGISGIGKTQITRTYAYNNQDYYELIWFIDCNLDINEELLKLAKAINQAMQTNVISEDILEVKGSVMDYLTCRDKWLIIFDNLKVKENEKIQEFITWEHNGKVIFCSQDMEMLPNVVKVSQFNYDEAVMLAKNVLQTSNHKFVEWLAQEFQGYPILIMQGAQLLNNIQGLDKKEYKKKVRQFTNRIQLNLILAINELTPSAKRLLNKIALINNQSFSRELLSFITDDNNTLDDDIYQLCKFMLILSDNKNMFEMHDIIAQTIMELNAIHNKEYLKEIIDNFLKIRKNFFKEKSIEGTYLLLSLPTVSDNLASIIDNAEKYKVNTQLVEKLKCALLVQYLTIQDMYKAKIIVDALAKKIEYSVLEIWLMRDQQKRHYAGVLGLIGAYYKENSDFKTAAIFFTKALAILQKIPTHDTIKYNYISNLAMCQLLLGDINLAQDTFHKRNTLSEVNQAEINFTIYFDKFLLLFINGKYFEALEAINQHIALITKFIPPEEPMLIMDYIFRLKVLNYLAMYQDAHIQAEKMFNIYKGYTINPRIFASILTQMAKAELGLGNTDKALKDIQKAIGVFINDERRNPKNANYIDDPDLADSYVTQGDTFSTLGKLQAAIVAYRKAQTIYSHLYKNNSKNVAHVSYLYLQGAKAACTKQDLFFYKAFGKPQIKEFGIEHPNTIIMLKYCKEYNMYLWSK